MNAKKKTCKLCDVGFPLVEGDHIPTQSLGMIPVTRCLNAPPKPEPVQTERKHLVESAGYWFNGAGLIPARAAVFSMENAYNHVENALAAALRLMHEVNKARDRKQSYQPPRLEAFLDDVEEFLQKFPEFKP